MLFALLLLLLLVVIVVINRAEQRTLTGLGDSDVRRQAAARAATEWLRIRLRLMLTRMQLAQSVS